MTPLPNPEQKSFIKVNADGNTGYTFTLPMIYLSHLRVGHRPTGLFPASPGSVWAQGTVPDLVDTGRLEVTKENGVFVYKPLIATEYIFYRETPTEPIASFRSASGLSERDLELAYTQATYLAQEAKEARERSGVDQVADDFLKTVEIPYADFVPGFPGEYLTQLELPLNKAFSILFVGGKQVPRAHYDLTNGAPNYRVLITRLDLAQEIIRGELGCMVLDLSNWIRTAIDIGEKAITRPQLEDNIIDESKLEDGSVTTDKLKDGSVTTDKLEDGSVTTDKLEDGSVTPDKLQTGLSIPIVFETDDTLVGDGNTETPLGVNIDSLPKDPVAIENYTTWLTAPNETGGWSFSGSTSSVTGSGPFSVGNTTTMPSRPPRLVNVPTFVQVTVRLRSTNLGNWFIRCRISTPDANIVRDFQYDMLASQIRVPALFFVPAGLRFEAYVFAGASNAAVDFRVIPLALTLRN